MELSEPHTRVPGSSARTAAAASAYCAASCAGDIFAEPSLLQLKTLTSLPSSTTGRR
jgi:pyocin large subunit-like protein